MEQRTGEFDGKVLEEGENRTEEFNENVLAEENRTEEFNENLLAEEPMEIGGDQIIERPEIMDPTDPLNLASIQPVLAEACDEAGSSGGFGGGRKRERLMDPTFANEGFRVNDQRGNGNDEGFEQVQGEGNNFRSYLVAQKSDFGIIAARISPTSAWPFLVAVPAHLLDVDRKVHVGDSIQLGEVVKCEQEWEGGRGDGDARWINPNNMLNYQGKAGIVGAVISGPRSEGIGLIIHRRFKRDRSLTSSTVASPDLPCPARIYRYHYRDGLSDRDMCQNGILRLDMREIRRPPNVFYSPCYVLPGHSPFHRGNELKLHCPRVVIGARLEQVRYTFPFSDRLSMDEIRLGEKAMACALATQLEEIRLDQIKYTLGVNLVVKEEISQTQARFKFEYRVSTVKELVAMADWYDLDMPVNCRTFWGEMLAERPCGYGFVTKVKKTHDPNQELEYGLKVKIILAQQDARGQNNLDQWEALVAGDGPVPVVITPLQSSAALFNRMMLLAANAPSHSAEGGNEIMRALLGMGGKMPESTVEWKNINNKGVKRLMYGQRETAQFWLDDQKRVIFQQAPPGTGKTFTATSVAAATLANDPSARVLCLAPPIAVVKLVEEMEEAMAFEGLSLPMLALFSGNGKVKYASHIQRVSSHCLAAAVDSEEFINELSEAEQKKVKQYQKACERNPRLAQEASVGTILQEHKMRRICFATMSFCEQVPKLFENATHLIIDEAGQAPFTQVLALAYQLPSLRKILITGDRRQLKVHLTSLPVVVRDGFGLDSVIFNLDVAKGVDGTALTVSYRSHSSIVSCINAAFYRPHGEELICGRDDAERGGMLYIRRLPMPNSQNPLVLIHQQEGAARDVVSLSTSNSGQSNTAMLALWRLCRVLPEEMTIRCICLYAAQEIEIAQLVRTEGLQERVLVSTADASQGHEADIVVVVTTVARIQAEEDHGEPFWANPDRINVALSRARHGMFVIGNLLVLNQKPAWARFLQEAQRHTVVVPPSYFEASRREGLQHTDEGELMVPDERGELHSIRDGEYYARYGRRTAGRESGGQQRFEPYLNRLARQRAQDRNDRQGPSAEQDDGEEWPVLGQAAPGRGINQDMARNAPNWANRPGPGPMRGGNGRGRR